MEPIRLITIHPALVHVPLGVLPLLVLAYALARRGDSERWTFVGDVLLFITAAFTLLTATFGLLARNRARQVISERPSRFGAPGDPCYR